MVELHNTFDVVANTGERIRNSVNDLLLTMDPDGNSLQNKILQIVGEQLAFCSGATEKNNVLRVALEAVDGISSEIFSEAKKFYVTLHLASYKAKIKDNASYLPSEMPIDPYCAG